MRLIIAVSNRYLDLYIIGAYIDSAGGIRRSIYPSSRRRVRAKSNRSRRL